MKRTIQHIPDGLNLTIATESCALSNHLPISVETKQIVNIAAQCGDYRRNRIASLLRTGREAFNMLLKLIENRTQKIPGPSKIILQPVPFFRHSSLRNIQASTMATKYEEVFRNLITKIQNTNIMKHFYVTDG